MIKWEQRLLLEALKRELKAQGISYQEMAKRLSVSEPTIKRILTGRPCTVDRLISICHELNLSLFEVAARARDKQAPFYFLTPKQEKYFLTHPHVYWFLHRLNRGVSLAQVRQDSELDEMVTYRYLRALEKLSLLVVGPDNHFRFTFKGLVQWPRHGEMVKPEAAFATTASGRHAEELGPPQGRSLDQVV